TSSARDHSLVGTTAYRLLADIPDPLKYPNSEVILYAALGDTPANNAGLPSSNRGGIYRSVNLGNTWDPVGFADVTDVALAPGSQGANGNLQDMYVAVKGVGIFFTPSATVGTSLS